MLLFPAGVLVLMMLSAIAVDLSHVHLARRALVRAASQAADDGAGAISEESLRNNGVARIDPARASQIIRYELAVADLPGKITDGPHIEFTPDGQHINVTVDLEVAPIFGKAVRGADGTDRIHVSVSSRVLATS